MKTISLDTNVILRHLLDDVPGQVRELDRCMERARRGRISLYVSKIAIVEAYYVLLKLYKKPRKEVLTALSSLINSDFLLIESRGVIFEAIELAKVEIGVSLADCILFAESKELGYDFMTFDKKLQALSKLDQSNREARVR
jgi:predicted nucleic-acid-binding protein